MNKKLILGAFLLAVPIAAAQAMPLNTFLARADALEKKGMMALFSGGEIKILKAEVMNATKALGDERKAARQAGRRTAYCPPDKASLSSKELLAHFRAIPPAQRQRMEVKDGLRSLFVRKYPCPA